jgi:type VI secretion system protein VasD
MTGIMLSACSWFSKPSPPSPPDAPSAPSAPDVPSALNAAATTPSNSNAPKPVRSVHLRLYAGQNLNVDQQGRPLALVTRIYKLRDATAFNQAPFEVFLNPDREKQAFGNDLVDVRELLLLPGQHYEVDEGVPAGATALGVVALFRDPGPERWRFAFDITRSTRSGITIGAHACAMTATEGVLVGGDVSPMQLLSSVHCQ